MKLRNKKTGEIKELPDGFFCGDNLKDEEWELIKDKTPDSVKELSSKITDKVIASVEEYLPKSIKGIPVVKYYEMNKTEVEKTLQWLNGKFVDRYVEVPAVNALLRILGYVDLFVCDFDADHQKVYHFNMIEERAKYESDKQMASR